MNKKELRKMSMKELRNIGNKIGAKDTSKEELIEEILSRTYGDTPTQTLIIQIENREGDAVETYSLRQAILNKLRKLDKIEREE